MATTFTSSAKIMGAGPPRSAAEAVLRETFGVEVQLWSRRHDASPAAWQPIEEGAPPASSALAAALEQAAASGHGHALAPWSDSQWVAVLPVRGSAGQQLWASAVVTTQDPNLLARLVSHARQRMDLEWQVRMLSEERDLLICQAQEDLEELACLRRTLEHLSRAEISLDVHELARIVLSDLREQLHAEAVVLVSAGRDRTSWLVGRPVVSVGHHGLDDRACMRLVEQFCDIAARQPVVRNDCQTRPEMQGFDGVHSFILAPMQRSQAVIAWVLAINRLHAPSGVTNPGQFEASPHEFGPNEVSLLRSTVAILAMHATNIDLFRDKEQMFLDIVRALVSAVEAKDQYTSGHSERVGLYARNLGAALGFNAKGCQRLYLAGLLHDVGKIGVQDQLLTTPQTLADQEFADVQKHAEKGWEILYGLEALDDILLGVLHHHERWDGRGYPDGLQGDMIPLDARILAVTDAYDAMTSDRPYRQALPQEQAEEILRRGAGVQWDPAIVEAFLRIMPETQRLRETHEPRTPPNRRGYGMLRDGGFERLDTDRAFV